MHSSASADCFAALSHYSVIRASGADARGFLQAQLTSDLRELTPGRSQLSAWCSAKGRVQAIFRLFVRGEEIYLRVPTELIPLTLPRLKMFVLRTKVALDAPAWNALGLSGSTMAAKLSELFGRAPETVNEVLHAPELAVTRVPGETPRFEIWGPEAAIASLREKLAQTGLREGSAADWRLLELQAGLPELHLETREAFTPHMLNLDLLGAVSFRKGCYPGQEVVAKTQHRGLAKRRLFLASYHGAAALPGARVLSADGQHAGDVVEALIRSDGTCWLSAVLMLEQANSFLRLADSPLELQAQAPPYPLA